MPSARAGKFSSAKWCWNMPLTSKNLPGKKARQAEIHRQQSIQILLDEQREKGTYLMFKSVKIHAMHLDSGLRCEFELPEGANLDTVKSAAAALKASGFVPVASQKQERQDNAGKTGKVASIKKRDGKEQWDVIVKLNEPDEGEQRLIAFSATQFRVGDLVKLDRNEKGYYIGIILDPATGAPYPF